MSRLVRLLGGVVFCLGVSGVDRVGGADDEDASCPGEGCGFAYDRREGEDNCQEYDC